MPKRRPPMRLCLGCGAQRDKRELVRIVRTPEGEVRVDPTGKANGRGAYICPQGECLDRALKSKRLGRALEAEVSQGTVDGLRTQLGPVP